MVRELSVSIYLLFFSMLFRVFKVFPQKKKVVFIVTFIANSSNIYDEIRRQDPSCRTIFLTSNKVFPFYSRYDDAKVLKFEPKHFRQFITSIYHLATAKVVVVDNYYGFLSSIKFKKNVKCLQVWHASGAIKQFGLKDPSIKTRKKRAVERFKKVYENFDNIIVGSEEMANIFKEAFLLKDEQILRLGIPSTDVYYNEDLTRIIKEQMYSKFPFLESKKVILYAPTYRDDQLSDYELKLDLSRMQKELKDDFIILLRLHPAIQNNLDIKQFEGFAYDFSNYKKLQDILVITDILVSDYSSIPFDFSLLEKPMIFYPYDLEQYSQTRGFWENYSNMVPGPVVKSTHELTECINAGFNNIERIRGFRRKWNAYSNGDASKNVASWIIEHLA